MTLSITTRLDYYRPVISITDNQLQQPLATATGSRLRQLYNFPIFRIYQVVSFIIH